jgi:hypothetical protein
MVDLKLFFQEWKKYALLNKIRRETQFLRAKYSSIKITKSEFNSIDFEMKSKFASAIRYLIKRDYFYKWKWVTSDITIMKLAFHNLKLRTKIQKGINLSIES